MKQLTSSMLKISKRNNNTVKSCYFRIFFGFLITFYASLSFGKDVYLGIEEPGVGRLIAGHAFLIVTESGLSPLVGTSYSYGVTGSIEEISQGHFPTQFSKREAPSMLYYREVIIQDNRSIYLVKLRLTSDEVDHLERLVKDEMLSPDFSKKISYELLDSNCITHLIDLINQAVGNERKINLRGQKSGILGILEKIKNYRNRQQLSIPSHVVLALKDHPIIDGAITYMPSFGLQQKVKFQKELLPLIKQLSQCAQWHQETQHMVALVVTLGIRAKDEFYFRTLRKLIKGSGCVEHKELVGRLWATVHDILPMTDVSLRNLLFSWKREVNLK